MKHIYLLLSFSVALASCAVAQPAAPAAKRKPEPVPVVSKPLAERGLQIAVAPDAPAAVREAAAKILQDAPQNPLLKFMAGAHLPTALSDSTQLAGGPAGPRAFDHLVVVGLPTDALMQAAWAHEAKFDGPNVYIFGFGHLRGDIGYLESDRNPFLHSRLVTKNLYETEIVLVTGTTPRGVALAADAFLKGLVNGVVAAPGWTRPAPNLLERDPLAPDWTPPSGFPATIGDWTRVGFTQAGEDEYRGVEADTTLVPKQIWRAKYVEDGVWDKGGAQNAFDNYSWGLHRRASGNTVWGAQFESADAVKAHIPEIGRRASLTRSGAFWQGKQPPYPYDKIPSGDLALWAQGTWVWMSTLPSAATATLRAATP